MRLLSIDIRDNPTDVEMKQRHAKWLLYNGNLP